MPADSSGTLPDHHVISTDKFREMMNVAVHSYASLDSENQVLKEEYSKLLLNRASSQSFSDFGSVKRERLQTAEDDPCRFSEPSSHRVSYALDQPSSHRVSYEFNQSCPTTSSTKTSVDIDNPKAFDWIDGDILWERPRVWSKDMCTSPTLTENLEDALKLHEIELVDDQRSSTISESRPSFRQKQVHYQKQAPLPLRSTLSSGSGSFKSLGSAFAVFPLWFDAKIMQRPEYESHAESSPTLQLTTTFLEKRDQDWCVLHPVGRLRLSWDFTSVMCILLEFWFTPFELIFLDGCDPPLSFGILSHCITGFFVADIFLNCSTGYIDGTRTIMRRRKILVNYFRFWFWLDLIATIPFEVIVSASGQLMQVTRAAKVAKGVRVLRYLKMLRMVKLMKSMQKQSNLAKKMLIFKPIRVLRLPCAFLCVLCFVSHVNGCVFALLQPEWSACLKDVPGRSPVKIYLEAFQWSWAGLTGSPPIPYTAPADGISIWILQMVIAFERGLAFAAVLWFVCFQSLSYVDSARSAKDEVNMLTYLQQHKVTFYTQTQVWMRMTETRKTNMLARSFQDLLSRDFPVELRRTICSEMWVARLLSFDLIGHINNWQPEFATELAQIVNEEVLSSGATLFRAGTPSIVCYQVLSGELMAMPVHGIDKVPNFTTGMWVGESALVSLLLRRSATFIAKGITSLMAIPGNSFMELISHFGLMTDYQDFCSRELWRGVCGRCGRLGHHFSDSCVVYEARSLGTGPSSNHHRISPNAGAIGSLTSSQFHRGHSTRRVLSKELMWYLESRGLLEFVPTLELLGIETLDAAKEADLHSLQKRIDKGLLERLPLLVQAFEESAIGKFRAVVERKARKNLFKAISRLHHFIFLSHYKVEAGTEAALMRTELELDIKNDPGHVGNQFDNPVFLDSDNLDDLEDLRERVNDTHNLVLLLTKGVLLRPWVLVEIVTAKRQQVNVLLVNISKPGTQFEFPDDAFFAQLREGKLLDEESVDLLRRCDCSMDDIEDALRSTFSKIAVPYSPHKAASIRHAEIEALLKLCKTKHGGFKTIAGQSSNGDDRMHLVPTNHTTSVKKRISTASKVSRVSYNGSHEEDRGYSSLRPSM